MRLNQAILRSPSAKERALREAEFALWKHLRGGGMSFAAGGTNRFGRLFHDEGEMFAQPVTNTFFLARVDHPLPADVARALIVLGNDVRIPSQY